MCTVVEMQSVLRDLINMPRKQAALLRDKVDWYKLCTSLDVIRDADLALDSYLLYEIEQEHGAKYLYAYGVLQALFLQQDAVCHLHEALDLSYEPEPCLQELREVRNDSIGHPTKRGKGRGFSFSFLSRPTMCKNGFTLLTFFAKGDPKIRDIKEPELITVQRKALIKALRQVVIKLKQEEQEFRNMHKEKKLINHFPGTSGYCFGKLFEYASSPQMFAMAKGLLSEIRSEIKSFRTELADRGMETSFSGVVSVLSDLQYPICELSTYFEGKEAYLNPQSARIFIDYLRGKYAELADMAKEIDAEMEKEI